jgi:DNA-binding Lrp family transcriptional regulator
MNVISETEVAKAASAYKTHGSERKAARALGLSKTTVHDRLKRAAEQGLLGFKPVLPGYELKRSSAQLDKHGGVEKEWVTQHKESGPAFAMPAGQVLKGVSAFVDAEGRIRHQWIKTKSDSAAPELIEALKREFAAYRGRAHIVPPPRRVERDLLAVYPIADPHVGMLSWRPQTGADYDLKIAKERMLDCASSIVAKTDRAREALIVNLGDWYHANDQRNVTPKSKHQLDVDGRWFKVQQAGVNVFRSIIDMTLAKHERVEVVNIPGNHDPEAAGALALALSGFYERNRRVKIGFPADIYYRRFGNTLLGAAHGDKLPPQRMAMAMAVDEREAWGATAYHWFMFGHIHKDTLNTVGDVRVESFSTIADKDSHAFAGGWRNAQALQSIVLHRRGGEDNRQRVNIAPPSMR